MSYISHSEFKNLMSKFQAETPKGMLKEAVDVKDRGYQDNITPESPLDEEDEMEESIHNTAQMGGILSNHQAEDREAIKVIKDKISKGLSKGLSKEEAIEDAIKATAEDYNYDPDYLTKLFNNHIESGKEMEEEGAGIMHFKDQEAKEAGKKSFKLGGKVYPVKEKYKPNYKDTAKGVVPEYRFDQMYPEDPGPFEESNLNEEGNYSKIIPALKAKGITSTMPEPKIFKAVAEVMKELGYELKDITYNMNDHDFLPDLLSMLKQSEKEDLVSKILKYVKDPDDAEHYASHPESMPSWLKHMIKGDKKQDMPGFGGTHDALDKLSIREDDMEENIYEPLQKATGPTIMQKEDMTGRFEVLSPDERKQLKEYIESLKTIKKEIATLLEKAGKSNMMESDKAGYVKGGEIKNKKKETDTKHPATIKAKYHEPTHKQKTGGDRTNLVMKKGEMWESHEPDMDPKHEEMESKIDPKLHDVLHKVADKVISELEAAGFTRQEALMFLDHEIAEKGEEAKMDQYNPF